jgi:hypothetical protein
MSMSVQQLHEASCVTIGIERHPFFQLQVACGRDIDPAHHSHVHSFMLLLHTHAHILRNAVQKILAVASRLS